MPRVCDDVMKWKHFPRYWPFVRGIHRSPVNSSHKGQWRGALVFSLISAWINGWVNTREADDLRRHRAHYDVIVMVRDCIWFMIESLWYMISLYYHVLNNHLNVMLSIGQWPAPQTLGQDRSDLFLMVVCTFGNRIFAWCILNWGKLL